MSNAAHHHKINYIEFRSTDIEQTKRFYSTVFGWTFQDYGPEYISFQGAGIDGGFAKSEPHPEPVKGAPLVVLLSPFSTRLSSLPTDGVRFELTIPGSPVCRFSRPVPSTTRPPLQGL